MRKKNIYIVPNDDGGWNVKSEGSLRAIKHFETKAPAKVYAKKLAKKNKSELIEQNMHGKIISKDSFGNDPIPPKDKEH